MKLSESEKLKHCSWCKRDYLNQTGNKRCPMLATMRLVMKKEVHIDAHPPWKQKAKQWPSCYSRENFCYVDPKTTC